MSERKQGPRRGAHEMYVKNEKTKQLCNYVRDLLKRGIAAEDDKERIIGGNYRWID